MATRANLDRSSFSTSGRSSLAIQTPISPAAARASSVSRWAFQTATGTITWPAGTGRAAMASASGATPPSAASGARSTCHVSSTTTRPLMIRFFTASDIFILSNQATGFDDLRGVHKFLERRDAQALRTVGERFVFVAIAHIHLQQAAYHFRHLQRGERWSDDLADGGVVALRAADRHLVPFAAVLVDAQHADAADVVVAAGVDAARDIQFDLADVVLEVDIVEALRDGGGDRQRFGVGQRAEVAARAADHVGQQADVRRRQALGLDLFPQREQLRLLDVGRHDVLLVRDAQFAEAVAVRQVGHEVNLFGGGVARRHAGLLQRQHHGGVARLLVRLDVAADPVGESLVAALRGDHVAVVQLLVGRRLEVVDHALHLFDGQRFRAVFQVGPFRFDLARELLDADGLQQDLDAGLVLVVAAAVLVIHAHHGLGVGQHVLPRQELADHAAQDRGAAHAAAGHELEADLAGLVAHHGQADVVHGDRRAVLDGAVDGDLELARQGDEFRVERSE